MGKVIIKGLAGDVHCEENESVDVSLIDGIDCQDDFVDYMDDDFRDKLNSGYMDFRLEDGKLYTYTVYDTNEELTEDELEKLGDYTQGQWSDGIGEGFEQFPCTYDDNDHDVFVSPWYYGQVLEIKQDV